MAGGAFPSWVVLREGDEDKASCTKDLAAGNRYPAEVVLLNPVDLLPICVSPLM